MLIHSIALIWRLSYRNVKFYELESTELTIQNIKKIKKSMPLK